jgi:NADH-ubiquinone oxidoreductase chain 6
MTAVLLDLLAAGAIFTSVLVITATSPVAMVVYLIGVFIQSAAYLLLLGLGFVGLSYLVVYVGAVAVLFLFVVMMLNVRAADVTASGHSYARGLPLGLVVGTLFLFEVLSVLPAASTHAGELAVGLFHMLNTAGVGLDTAALTGSHVHLVYAVPSPDTSFTGGLTQVQALGQSLYGHGAIMLIVTSVILLLAMLGPIALCLRPRPVTA